MMKNLYESTASKLTIISFWVVRLTLGVSFFFHGWGKFPLPPEKLTTWFEKIDMIAPDAVATIVAIGEVGAGIGIILGGFLAGKLGNFVTRLSSLGILIIMIGAFYLAHSDWFINENLFKSEQIYIFVLSIFFLINGNRS